MSTRDDRGETLTEMLVTVVILGTAVIALLGALATAIKVSEFHRKQAEAGVYVKAFAETLENRVATQSTNYLSCGTGAGYESLYPDPAGYDASVVTVKYWNGTQFVDTCATDSGVQLLTLRVSAEGELAVHEDLDVTLRKPCRPTELPCG